MEGATRACGPLLALGPLGALGALGASFTLSPLRPLRPLRPGSAARALRPLLALQIILGLSQTAALNAAYSAAFAGVAPAARAAVELPLAAGRAFCLEAVRQ